MENNQSSQQQQVIDNSHYEKMVALLEQQTNKSNDIYETSQVQAATLLWILVTILTIMMGNLFMSIFKILK